MRCARQQRHGFTLIELIIVTMIVGVVAAILIPAFTSSKDHERTAAGTCAPATRTAERSGLRNAEVVWTFRAYHLSHHDRMLAGCMADDDVVCQIEGTDAKEQRARMILCCHPGPDNPICALPSPSVAFSPGR